MKPILIFLPLLLAAAGARAQQAPDPAVFADPPAQYQTAAWWHWMDGAIPAFGSTATVTLNGHTLETIWDPAALTDVTSCVREGDNELVITVTNPWRNRLIGDKAGVPSTEKHWTTSPLQQKHIPPQQILHEYAKLYPAGISKPVTFYSEGEERVVNN